MRLSSIQRLKCTSIIEEGSKSVSLQKKVFCIVSFIGGSTVHHNSSDLTVFTLVWDNSQVSRKLTHACHISCEFSAGREDLAWSPGPSPLVGGAWG